MPFDETLLARVRTLVEGRSDVVEKSMMGSRVFMVGGHMAFGVNRHGLMIRVGKDGAAAALKEPHVKPMAIGARSPAGFVVVDPAGVSDEASLAAWLQRGLAFVATLPPR